MKTGTNTVIQRNVNITAPENIVLGDNVQIEYGVTLKCHHPGSNERIIINDNVRVQEYVLIHSLMGSVEIGEGSYIGPHTVIYGHCRDEKGGTKIGKNVLIAGHCFIIPANHMYHDADKPIISQGFESRGIVIGDDVWIGANCTILDGVTVGNGAVVAAGSVVKNDVPEYCMVAGVPAVFKKHRVKSISNNRKSEKPSYINNDGELEKIMNTTKIQRTSGNGNGKGEATSSEAVRKNSEVEKQDEDGVLSVASLAAFASIAAIQPDKEEIYPALCNLYLSTGRTDVPRDWIMKASKKGNASDISRKIIDISENLLLEDKAEQAIGLLSVLVEADPDNYDAYNDLGVAQLQMLEKAEESFKRAILIGKGAGEAHKNLISYYLMTGKQETAIDCCRKALEDDSGISPEIRDELENYLEHA